MEFIYVKARELESFVDDLASAGNHTLPITPWRAHSQVHNPYVDENDVLLIVSLGEDKKINGYIGILPVSLHRYQNEKVYFNTCWRADPESGGIASFQLFLKFLQYTAGRVLFSDLTKKTRMILEKSGEFSFKEREGALIRLRWSLANRAARNKSNGIPDRIARFPGFIKIASLIDWAGNSFYKPFIRKFLSAETSLTTGYHSLLSPGMEEFISDHAREDEIFIPCLQDAEWWRNYPWLMPETGENKELGKRYFFSAFADDFHYVWQEIFDEDQRIGVACLSFRDGIVKTLYLWYDDKQKEAFFVELFRNIISDPANHTLISFHEDFVQYIHRLNGPWQKWEWHTRYTAVSDVVENFTGKDWKMQDGYGDYVFT